MKTLTVHVLAAAAVLSACPGVSAADRFTLAEDGVPKASIVLGTNAVKAARLAACELRHVVKMIAGAELPVLERPPADGSPAIFVGVSEESLARGVPDRPFEREAYLVQFKDGDLFLCGNDDPDHSAFDYADAKTFPDILYCYRSTTYAVYDFLEKFCGARFYSFGDTGVAFRPRATLRVATAAPVRRAPAMDAYRRAYFGSRTKEDGISPRDERLLLFRWRYNAMFGEVNHSVMGIWYRYWAPSKVASRAKFFIEKRPDYFAQGYEGKMAPNSIRTYDYPGDADLPPQLCTSSPGPVQFFADEANRLYNGEKVEGSFAAPFARRMPGQPFYYPVQEQDSGCWCKCAKCTADPKKSDYLYRHFDWVNRIAAAAAAKNPAIGVGTLAYSDTLEYQKGFDLATNVCVQICLGPQSWFHPSVYAWQHGCYKEWVEREAKRRPLMLWLYFLCPASEAERVHKYGKFFPVMYARHTGRFFKEFTADGIRGWFGEVMPRYQLLEAYVASKLSDDPSLDPDAMLDEFYDLYYGAAGSAMKAFCDTLEEISYDIANYTDTVRRDFPKTSYIYRFHRERDNWHLGSRENIARLNVLMDRAKAAASAPLEKARVKEFNDRIWNQAVEGRAEFEERERIRSIPVPRDTASYPGEAGGDPAQVDFAAARESVSWRKLNNTDAPTGTVMRFASDSGYFYLKFSEPGGEAAANMSKDIWLNGVEMFFGSKREADYLHVAVSPKGESVCYVNRIVAGVTRMDKRDIGLHVSSAADAKGWTFTMAVPLSEIPSDVVPGGVFFANFLRTKRFDGGESLAWSPIFTDSYLAGFYRMGELTLPKPSFRGALPIPSDFRAVDGQSLPEGWLLLGDGKLKDGESVSVSDGVLKLASGKTDLRVYRNKVFYPVKKGDKVVFSFKARGTGDWGVAGAFYMNGVNYGANSRLEWFKPSQEWKELRLAFTVEDRYPHLPVTSMRPALGVRPGSHVEFSELRVTVIPRD
ncbi:MAG TPA: DUF4838 domain-containing protein [Opitutales bacterium]|nr:DUF4838 domain-containing protein [Opitutales bacterium]